MRVHLLLLAALIASASMAGCALKEIADCEDTCRWADSCIDRDVDVDKCTDRCVDATEDSKPLADDAEQCVECIEDVACKDALRQCEASCQPVLEKAAPKLEYPAQQAQLRR